MVGWEGEDDDMPLAKRQRMLYEGRMRSEVAPKKADTTERRHSDSSEVIVLVSDSDNDNAAAAPPLPQQPRKKTPKQPAKPAVPPLQLSHPLQPPKMPREPQLPRTTEAKRQLPLKPLAQLTKRPRNSPSKPTKTISRDVPLKPLPGMREYESRPVQKPGRQQQKPQREAPPPPPPLKEAPPPPGPLPARVVEEVIIDDSSSDDEVEMVSFLPGVAKQQQETAAPLPAPSRPTPTTTTRPTKPPSLPPHEEVPTLSYRNGQALLLQTQPPPPPPPPPPQSYPPPSAPAAASGPFSAQRHLPSGAPASTISLPAYAFASTAPYRAGGSGGKEGGGGGGGAPEFRSREAAMEFRTKFRVNPVGVGGSMPSYTFSNKSGATRSGAGGSGSVKPRALPANRIFTKAAMVAHAKEILHDMTRPARQAMRKSQDAWNHAALKWREKNRPSEEEVQRRQQEDAARHHENAKFRQANGGTAPWTRPSAGPGPSQPAPPPQGPLPPAPPTDAPELEWRSYFRNLSQRQVTSAASFPQVLRAFGVECAGVDKVKDAYRQAVRMYHPDSNSKERVWSTPQEKVRSEEVMKIINERKEMEAQR